MVLIKSVTKQVSNYKFSGGFIKYVLGNFTIQITLNKKIFMKKNK